MRLNRLKIEIRGYLFLIKIKLFENQKFINGKKYNGKFAYFKKKL